MEKSVKPDVNRLSSKRIFLVTLSVLFVVLVSFASIGWFIGVIPTYPHMREWKVCSYPKIISSSLYGIERRQLFMAICFTTSDSWKEVADWYEPLGWTDYNGLTDDIGTPIIRRINLGSMGHLLVKRDVLFTLYEPIDVKVVAAYEIRSNVLHTDP